VPDFKAFAAASSCQSTRRMTSSLHALDASKRQHAASSTLHDLIIADSFLVVPLSVNFCPVRVEQQLHGLAVDLSVCVL
jgi:hypothetical protein